MFTCWPIVWLTEFHVTAFDRLLRKEPENSLVSDLGAEQIVGFRIWVGDFDEQAIDGADEPFTGKTYVLGDFFGMTGDDLAANEAGRLMDGILLPADGIVGTAAAPDSSGLIKTSLSP